jgi:hypothetical protein
MGSLIDLAKASIPEPMPEAGGNLEASDPNPLSSLPCKAEARQQKGLPLTDQIDRSPRTLRGARRYP